MSDYEVLKKKSYERPANLGDKVVELKAKFVSTTIKDVTQDGIKLEVNNQGQVKGKYEAMHMETTTITQKTDGTAEWETKAVETTPQGDYIIVTGAGQGKVIDPTSMKWEGELQYMTMSPKLAWLNGKKVWVDGTGNNVKGEMQATAYEIR